MKKFLSMFFIVLLIFSFTFNSSVKAISIPKIQYKKEINKNDYKKLMGKVKEIVVNGNNDTEINNKVNKLPEVIEFKKKYSKEQISKFLKNVDVFNQDLVDEKLKNVVVGKNERKIIEFKDGSFIVLQSNTLPITDISSIESNKNLTLQNRTLLSNHWTISGSNWKNDAKKQYWGIYLALETHLVTSFTVYSNKIHIYNTSATGTRSYLPTTVDMISTKVLTNDQKMVKSFGEYRKTNGIVLGGQPIGYSSIVSLETTISITSVIGDSITFSVNTVSGG